MEKFYPDNYGPHNSEGRTGAGEILPWRLQKILNAFSQWITGAEGISHNVDEFYARLKPGSCILDIGCGSGLFLDKMRSRGCITVGMDMSKAALAKVESKGHVSLLANGASWARLDDHTIDLIRMSHVVEHLYDPFEVFALAFQKLTRHGQLHIAIPNSRAWSAQVFRSHWYALDCPRHLFLPPPTLLESKLKKIGFDEVLILPQPAPQDAIRSLGYLLDDYRLLGRESSANLVYNTVLMLLFALPSRLFAELGRSDRYHVLARKGEAA